MQFAYSNYTYVAQFTIACKNYACIAIHLENEETKSLIKSLSKL